MKTKSVIIDDARGALGDQVIGTSWKGRNVLKAYKEPKQTETCTQLAHRDHQKKLVALYQTNIGPVPAAKAAWNIDAKPRRISGYNLFVQLGRNSMIACDPFYVPDATMTVACTLKQDVSTAYLGVEVTDPNFAEITIQPGDMQAGEWVEYEQTTPPTGVGPLKFYLCDARSKVLITGMPPKRDGIFNHFEVAMAPWCSAVPAISEEM